MNEKALVFTPTDRKVIDARWISNMYRFPPEFSWFFTRDAFQGNTLDEFTTLMFNRALKVLYSEEYTHFVYLQDDVFASPETIKELMQYQVGTCVIIEEKGSLEGKPRRSLYNGLVCQENPTMNGFVKSIHPDRFFVAKKEVMPRELRLGACEIVLEFSNVYFRTDLSVLHLYREERGV